MKILALLPLILSILAAALVAPRQPIETAAARVIAVSVLGGDDYTILPTVTAAPQTGGDVVQAADAAESTTTHTASIIQAVIPHEKDKIYIFPFHVEMTESCSRSSPKKIKGFWKNGDWAEGFELDAGKSLSIYHWIAGFPNFQLGPFDTGAETLRFRYENTVFYEAGEQNVCKWTDGETWRECGECRAALWSGPPLNCGAGGGERVCIRDCSSGVETC
jgi:hypothetical protein